MLDIKFEDFRKPKYRMAKEFHEGLAIVVTHENKYGFINKTGKEIIPCQFHSAESFNEGLAPVQNESGLWGYIDQEGKLVIRYQYRYASRFRNGLASIENDEGKYGYIDKKGTEMIPCQFKDARSFEDGYGIIQDDNNMYHYIDRESNLSDPYDECLNFDSGSAVVKQNEKHYLIGKDFQIKKELPDTIAIVYHSSCGMRMFLERKGNYGYMDHEGNSTILTYEFGNPFSDDVAVSILGGTWGILNKGKSFFPIAKADQYKKIGDFFEGFACTNQDARYGYIDKKGRELKSCQYLRPGRFSEGLACVTTEGWNISYIDKKGNTKFTLPDLYCSRLTYGENTTVLTATTTQELRKLKRQKLEEIKKAYVGEIEEAKQELKGPQFVLKENQ